MSKADLDQLKTRLDREPWKSAYAALVTQSTSSLSYTPRGPFAEVSRTPPVNLSAYQSDMEAIYRLALRGYLESDERYSRKAADLLVAWCTGHTAWTGNEAYLTSADYVVRSVVGAEILRGTYGGWSAADTVKCQDYFRTLYWPQYGVGGGARGAGSQIRSANQGADQLQGAVAVAVFLDDREKFDMVMNAYRTDPVGGLLDSLPNGEIGDTGRDQGHAYGELEHLAFVAETAWKQGIDLYGEQNNRLLAAMEYYAQYNLGASPPFIPFGTSYDLYTSIGGDRLLRPNTASNIIYTAYVVRKGLSAPYTTQYRALGTENVLSFPYLRDADTTRATPLPATWSPAPTAPALAGDLTARDLGSNRVAGHTQFDNGLWRLDSAGMKQESGYHFAHRTATGDFTLVARVAGIAGTGAAHAGLMVRSKLDAVASTPYVWLHTGEGSVGAQVFWRAGTGILVGNYINFTRVVGPYWLKLVRRGSFIQGWTSPDGVSWSPTSNVRFDALPETLYVGLATYSGDAAASATATFEQVSFGTAPSSRSAAPASLTATAANGAIRLDWPASAGAVYYVVERATAPGGPYTTLSSEVVGTGWSDSTAVPGTPYYYAVSASSYGGVSPRSSEAMAQR